jgi:hypothetical protein
MRWDRLQSLGPGDGGWAVHVIDTSMLSTDEVSAQLLTWCGRALGGEAPLMHVGGRGR